MKLFRLAAVSLALAATAFAAPPRVEVFTAGPDGFLVTSTLILGERDAVLVDSQFTLSEAHRLAARVLESKKNLKAIFITHGHPDHFFGLEVLKAQFPNVEIYASPAVLAELRTLAPAKLLQWKPVYGANLTNAPLLPRPFPADHYLLEGERIELLTLAAAESEAFTVFWIPSARTAITGDLTFTNVHVWLADTTPARRDNWIRSLQRVKALDPQVVIAGHEAPGAARTPAVLDDTAAYIRDFNAALASSRTPDELKQKMLARHGTRLLPVILEISAKAALPVPKI